MITIKTYLKEVPGKGIGVFTVEDIEPNTLIHKPDNIIDKRINKDLITKEYLDFIENYAVYESRYNTYYLCGDNARFLNHSDNPNIKYNPEDDCSYSSGFIKANTELLVDYRNVCDLCKHGLGFIVN